MGHDCVNNISFQGKMPEEMLKKESNNSNSLLIAKAQELGINVSKYYTYDEEGKVESIDTASLNAEIAKTTQEKKALEKTEIDSFNKTADGQKSPVEEEQAKVASLKNSINSEYNKALTEYANSFNKDADSTTDEGKLADKWAEIKAKSTKFIGVDASNTTVLEGAKEFINNICKVVNETKMTVDKKADEKESVFSIESKEEIELKENKIEAYGTIAEDNTNPFAGVYLKSAMETFGVEEEETDDAVA